MSAERRFYRLYFDPSIWDLWVLGVPHVNGVELLPWQFNTGKHFDRTEAMTVPVVQAGDPAEFSFGTFDVPYVSEAVGKLIESVVGDGEVQRIPVQVDGVAEPHEILNVLSVLDCIDRSTPDQLGERWVPVDPATAPMILRPAGPSVLHVVVAEELRAALLHAVPAGLRFTLAT